VGTPPKRGEGGVARRFNTGDAKDAASVSERGA
jgi:hypothetical protein